MTTQIKGNDTSTFGGNVDVTGNVITDAPAFSAYLPSNQSISSSTHTKVQCSVEEFDTNSNYDTSNYRFTPTVAGYYHITGAIRCDASSSLGRSIVNIYKNGTSWKRGNDINNALGWNVVVSAVIYLNGSTDYVELYSYITATTPVIGTAGFNLVYFQGYLARAV